MTNPLCLLRQYNINRKEINERGDHIIFGEYSWPKNVTTNYLIGRSFKKGNKEEYYTLECLLFFLKNISLTHVQYFNKAAAENIPAVWRPDRKALSAYLNGETDSSNSIDKSIKSEKPTRVKFTHDHEEGESAAKKPRIKEESNVDNIKKEKVPENNIKKEKVSEDNIKTEKVDDIKKENYMVDNTKRIKKEKDIRDKTTKLEVTDTIKKEITVDNIKKEKL